MELSAASLLEWTKLFIRDPRTAASLVKAAKLPLEVSVMMIVLAGVVSTAVSGIHTLLIGSPEIMIKISETQAMSFRPAGPFMQGLFAVATGVGMAYAIFRVGARSGGRGSLADIMAITAVLQLVVTVIVIGQFVFGLVLPLLGLVLMIFGLYVFFRGLGHAVNVGHGYDDMGKSVRIIVGSIVALSLGVLAVFVVLAIMGVGPEGTIVPLNEGLSL